jgi:CRISPR/Cas system-associated exonuclease Cas4 (RecB family)
MISSSAPARRPVGPPPVKPTRDYLSYSAITTYQACPLRYYFRYIAGLPERTVSASLVFGSAIHRSVEYHFNELMVGDEPPSLESLVGEYDRHWQEADPSIVKFGKDDDIESLGGLAQRMLGAFQASSLAKTDGTILGVEEELRGQAIPGVPDLLGRIDLIIETANAVVVTDLKTARTRWTQEQIEESYSQLLLYHELVRQFVPRKRLRLQFAVLTKTKQPAIDLHEVQADRQAIDRTKRIVERVWKAIDNQVFYPAPSPMQCPSCSFREQCRAWNG